MKSYFRLDCFALLVMTVFISACGFKPLYVEKKTEGKWYFGNEFDISINSEMEKVKVEPISDKFGQELRNGLVDILTPKGIPDFPVYRLHINLAEENVQRQALRKDITATRERVMYRVNYYMTSGGEELLRGDSIAYTSYDVMANPYSTTMAQKKSEADAAKIIANDISLRVGAYFHAKLAKDEDN
ncbi:MAG: hypothetical protein LBR70_01585 [Lactobacillaceae bacterium]|nr:hypothetical protein [Lactobacillaceae bacterium]